MGAADGWKGWGEGDLEKGDGLGTADDWKGWGEGGLSESGVLYMRLARLGGRAAGAAAGSTRGTWTEVMVSTCTRVLVSYRGTCEGEKTIEN